MKLTLAQPDLNHALRTVSRAVASGRTHPVLAHVLLTTGNGNLQVSAYDLDLGITTPAPAIIDTAGSITITYRLLADIIGRLEATDVVTLAATGTDVTVTTLSGSYKLSGGPAEDFPPCRLWWWLTRLPWHLRRLCCLQRPLMSRSRSSPASTCALQAVS
jgi:DNA polymerase III subunit beta